MQLQHLLSVHALCILLTFFLCFTQVLGAASCGATVQLAKRDGAWTENGSPRVIYDILLSNPTSSCSFGAPVILSLNVGGGCSIVSSWNYVVATGELKVSNSLTPSSSYSGGGFVHGGGCTPTVSVASVGSCACSTTGSASSSSSSTSTKSVTSTIGASSSTSAKSSTSSNSASTSSKSTTSSAPSSTSSKSTTSSAPSTTTAKATTGSTTGSPSQTYQVTLKFLVLTCATTDDIRLPVATQALNAVGSQYDILDFSVFGSGTLSLTNSDGSGKYSSIISTTELACWSATQQAQIATYETQFRVKLVILYSFPYPSNGVTISPKPGTSDAGTAKFTTAFSNFVRSVPSTAQIPVSGTYSYPSVISDPTLATSAMTITYTGTSTPYVLAAIISYPDGRKHLEFYVDQAIWATYPAIFANAWLDWVSNGLFAGLRRIEINAQIDDIFMATGIFDESTGEEGEDTYRITPSDLNAVVAWQNALNSRLPSGSHVLLTMPFNGATVIENGGYAVDPLFLRAKQLRENFFWETHTFEHPYLDGMNYADVKNQFVWNNATAQALFDNNLNNAYFCTQSAVTPSITGLFQADPLRAMYDAGIRNVVGDNSRPELVPSNVYHGITTTVATHGFAGMYIVPRHATNIFYYVSLPDELVTAYNFMYRAYWGRDLTFDEIINTEIDSQIRFLLSYRIDPFMFHQANLRTFTYGGATTSLVGHWADRMVENLQKYSTFPVTSHKHDDLAKMWKDRESRDACGVVAKLNIDVATNRILGLTASSSQSCKYAITGASSAQASSSETYGADQTMWLQMTPNTPFSVTFTTPITQN